MYITPTQTQHTQFFHPDISPATYPATTISRWYHAYAFSENALAHQHYSCIGLNSKRVHENTTRRGTIVGIRSQPCVTGCRLTDGLYSGLDIAENTWSHGTNQTRHIGKFFSLLTHPIPRPKKQKKSFFVTKSEFPFFCKYFFICALFMQQLLPLIFYKSQNPWILNTNIHVYRFTLLPKQNKIKGKHHDKYKRISQKYLSLFVYILSLIFHDSS